MKRIKYFIQRVFGLDYKRLFEVAGIVSKRTGKPKLFYIFDIVVCGFKYQAGYSDYLEFEFYNLNAFQRSSYVTRGLNYDFVVRLNDREARRRLENKVYFLEDFGDLMGRRWLDLETASYEEFVAFTNEVPNVVLKPVDGICGKGIQFVTVTEENVRNVYETALKDNTMLVEQEIKQHHELDVLHPHSMNTLRVMTIKVNGNVGIPYICVRTGNGTKVDNLNAGGYAARVDVETGEIISDGFGKYSSLAVVHPVTGVQFKGFKIPLFNEAIDLAIKAAERLENVNYVGWDIGITENGPIVIEANDFPGNDLTQSPIALGKDKLGMRYVFEDMIRDLSKLPPKTK